MKKPANKPTTIVKKDIRNTDLYVYVCNSKSVSYTRDEVVDYLNIPIGILDEWCLNQYNTPSFGKLFGYTEIKEFAKSNTEFTDLNNVIDIIESDIDNLNISMNPYNFMGSRYATAAPFPNYYTPPTSEIHPFNRFYNTFGDIGARGGTGLIRNELNAAISKLKKDIDIANEYLKVLTAMLNSIDGDNRKMEDK